MKKMMMTVLAAAMVLSTAACGQTDKAAETAKQAEGTAAPMTEAAEQLVGGWTRPESTAISEEAKAVFEKGMEGFVGVDYHPVALLGTQVVAGRNYCFLCEATVVYPGAETGYALVYLYEDLKGNVEITDIVNLETDDAASAEESPSVQIANPFVSYDSLAEAEKAVGFELRAPERVEGYEERIIQAIDGDLIQVIFRKGDSRLFLRKALGSEDVSGDYNDYAVTQTVQVGENSVTMKGDGALVSLAIWTAGDYTYAVTTDEAMSVEAMTALAAQIG